MVQFTDRIRRIEPFAPLPAYYPKISRANPGHNLRIRKLPQGIFPDPNSRFIGHRDKSATHLKSLTVQPLVSLPDLAKRPVDSLADKVPRIAGCLLDQSEERKKTFILRRFVSNCQCSHQRKRCTTHKLLLSQSILINLVISEGRQPKQILTTLVTNIPRIELFRPAIDQFGGCLFRIGNHRSQNPGFMPSAVPQLDRQFMLVTVHPGHLPQERHRNPHRPLDRNPETCHSRPMIFRCNRPHLIQNRLQRGHINLLFRDRQRIYRRIFQDCTIFAANLIKK